MKALLPVLILLFPLTSLAQSDANLCVDRDGDGWGWDGSKSCQTSNFNSKTCVDRDGDGWGWDGEKSCRKSSEPANTPQTSNATVDSSECVDTDGDGWGWDGKASCRMENTQTISGNTGTTLPAPVTTTTAAAVTTTTLAASQNNSDFARRDCDRIIRPSDSLQNAINSAPSGGSTICLEAGNYPARTTLKLKSNIDLIGLGKNASAQIRIFDIRGVVLNKVNNAHIENITVDGNNTSSPEFGVLLTESRHVTFSDINIQNIQGIGIGIHSSHKVSFLGGNIRNIGQDVKLRQAVWASNKSTDVLIDGLTVTGRPNDTRGGDHAITCIEVDGFTVKNSTSRHAGSGAVAIRSCDNIIVENNKLYFGKEHGVDIVDGSTGALVRNNYIEGMSLTGMVFDDHNWKDGANMGTNPTEIVVSNNTMKGNNKTGIAKCFGIAVDKKMTVNPSRAQRDNTRWVEIVANNKVDKGPLHCQHIH